jgi:hypothetical protein
MISAHSENEQATTITLTQTELEGIYGGWGHDCGDRSDYCGGESIDINIDIDISSCDNYDSYNCGDRRRRRCW